MNKRPKFKFVNKLFPLKLLACITGQKILLPFYHTISDVRHPHISNLYLLKTKRQFISDLDYLCKHFTPVSIHELRGIIRTQPSIKKPVFHLAFDDGLKEVYTEIAPILTEKGIPATLFLNTDFIDNKALFYRYKISLIIESLDGQNTNNQKIAEILQISRKTPSDIKNILLRLTWQELAYQD